MPSCFEARCQHGGHQVQQRPACPALEVNARRITAQRAYHDQMTLALQLGLVPDTAAAS